MSTGEWVAAVIGGIGVIVAIVIGVLQLRKRGERGQQAEDTSAEAPELVLTILGQAIWGYASHGASSLVYAKARIGNMGTADTTAEDAELRWEDAASAHPAWEPRDGHITIVGGGQKGQPMFGAVVHALHSQPRKVAAGAPVTVALAFECRERLTERQPQIKLRLHVQDIAGRRWSSESFQACLHGTPKRE